MKTQVFVLAFVITCCGSAGAQTPDVCATSNATTFDGWVQSLIDSVICKQQVGENGKGSDRQKESPSADPRSTSLVDQSSATDFFSVAANVIPVSQELSKFVAPGTTSSDAGASGSTTVTATLYALLAGFDKTSPTDPVFYKNHVNARRISFTIGTAVSTQATDNTTTPATVYGTKILLINGRDLYTRKNLDAVSAAQKAVSIAAATSVNMKARVKEVMFLTLHPDGGEKEREDFNLTAFSEVNFPNTLRALSPEALKQIQTLIEGFIDAFVGERKTLQDAYDQIHNARQRLYRSQVSCRLQGRPICHQLSGRPHEVQLCLGQDSDSIDLQRRREMANKSETSVYVRVQAEHTARLRNRLANRVQVRKPDCADQSDKLRGSARSVYRHLTSSAGIQVDDAWVGCGRLPARSLHPRGRVSRPALTSPRCHDLGIARIQETLSMMTRELTDWPEDLGQIRVTML